MRLYNTLTRKVENFIPNNKVIPEKIEYTVVHTEPAVKGNTTTNATKDAELENGLVVRVPLFIEDGEVIIVSTKDGKYDSRL